MLDGPLTAALIKSQGDGDDFISGFATTTKYDAKSLDRTMRAEGEMDLRSVRTKTTYKIKFAMDRYAKTDKWDIILIGVNGVMLKKGLSPHKLVLKKGQKGEIVVISAGS
jgi:hypothetical protein